MYGSTDHADSAGRPWQGRSFDTNEYAQDDGTAPSELIDALVQFRSEETEELRTQLHQHVIDVVRTSRLLIPLIAEAGDVGITAEGLAVDKTQELSIVTVAGPQGQKVLPVFSSVDAMKQWNTTSRPVPVEARRAALAAAADGAQWMVLDPASETALVIKRPEVEAIAQDIPWIPAFSDENIAEVISRSCDAEESVQGFQLLSGDPYARGQGEDLIVQLTLSPGLEASQVEALIQRLTQSWAQTTVFAEKVDAMRVQILSAT